MFLTKGRNRIGSSYKKVRYVEYTDDTFMTKMLRAPEEKHLGILGKPDSAGSDLSFSVRVIILRECHKTTETLELTKGL